jgi:cation-transporting ATPase 13A1
MGLLTAFCFLFISRSEPLPELSAKKPLPNLFSIYMLLAVVGQFTIHLLSMIYVVDKAQEYYTG